MPQAKIKINSVIGSNTNLPINTLVQFDNDGIGGELTYAWTILDQPEGPVDSLSSPNIQNPTFTPKKQGTYLIRLIVNTGLANEQEDQVVAAILEVKTLLRIPAAGETLEANNLRGWAQSTNELLIAYSDFLADGAVFVGVNASGSSISRGTVVKAIASSVILSGLPQQQVVPGFSPALSTLRTNVDQLLCVVEQGVDGATTVLAGKLFQARYLGRIGGLPLGSGSVGDTVYVNDTAQLSTTPGTVKRQIGSIMSAAGANRDVFFDGVGGADITPIDAPYVVYGNPGMLTNAFRVDGDNATPATGGIAWTFPSGSNVTRSLVAKRFGAAQTVKVFEVQRENDTIAFFSVGPDGTIEWQTETADANGVVVGAMDWRDVNSSAADKRVAQILGKLNGATADNRGGEIDVLLKSNGASGLTTVATFGASVALTLAGVANAILATSSGAGSTIAGTNTANGFGVAGQVSGTGQGVVGQSTGVGGGEGVRGISNGNGPAVNGLNFGSGPALKGNANLDLSGQSAPATTTGIPYGIMNALTMVRAWGLINCQSGVFTVLAGQNILGITIDSSGLHNPIVAFTSGFVSGTSFGTIAMGAGETVQLISSALVGVQDVGGASVTFRYGNNSTDWNTLANSTFAFVCFGK